MKKKRNNNDMRNLIALGFFLLAVSCNSNKNNADTGYDMSKFEPPVIAKSDTQALATVGVLSVDELKDDSVFADGSIPTSWENAGVTDVQALKLFLKQLQQLVIVNDKTGLADHVQYPLKDIQVKRS